MDFGLLARPKQASKYHAALSHPYCHLITLIELLGGTPSSSEIISRNAAPLERRGQGTDRSGFLSPGAIVSEAARRHDISPQHRSLGARRRGPARLARRPTRHRCSSRWLTDHDGSMPAVVADDSGVITIEIGGMVVRAAPGPTQYVCEMCCGP